MSTCNTYALGSLWCITLVQSLGESFCPLTLVGNVKTIVLITCPITMIKHLRSSWQGGHGRKKGSCDFLSLLVEIQADQKVEQGQAAGGLENLKACPTDPLRQHCSASPGEENLVLTTLSSGRPFVPKP